MCARKLSELPGKKKLHSVSHTFPGFDPDSASSVADSASYIIWKQQH